MKIRAVTIYRPDGKGYLEVGKKLLNEEGSETDVMVTGMKLLFGKIIVLFSTGERIIYGKFPYVATKL